jgi:hypothetical protein
MIRKILFTSVLLGLSGLPLMASASSSCADLKPSFIDKLADKICDQLDMKTPTIEELKAAKNPLIYTNPDTVGCDLGFSMPGLPSFGTKIDGLDACSVLKAVTGDMVGKANTAMKDGLNGALQEVKNQTGVTPGTKTISVDDMVKDSVKQQ